MYTCTHKKMEVSPCFSKQFHFFFAFDACDKKTRSCAWVMITVFAH